MSRFNVYDEQNDKWACFSTIVDDFITDWKSDTDYDDWRKKEYGKDWCPLDNANQMELQEALKIIKRKEELDMINNLEIKCCPFCGSNAILEVNIEESVMSEPFYKASVVCSDSSCGASIKKVDGVCSTTKEAMIKLVTNAWNSRVIDRSIDDE